MIKLVHWRDLHTQLDRQTPSANPSLAFNESARYRFRYRYNRANHSLNQYNYLKLTKASPARGGAICYSFSQTGTA